MNARVDRFAPLVLGGLVLILHGTALRLPLFADDFLFLDRVRNTGLLDALAQPDALGNFWRPLTRQAYFWVVSHGLAESPLACHVINLATVLACLWLLFGLVKRLAGSRAAWTAVLVVAPVTAWDVPIMWGSGTQDLFAILFALVALHFAERRRPLFSAAFYGLALFSKEVVLLLPGIVVLLAWRRGRPLRTALAAALPHAVVAVAWAILWTMRMRVSPGGSALLQVGPLDPFAAFVHFLQALLGLEFGPAERLRPALLFASAACAAIGLVVLKGSTARIGGSEDRANPQVIGAAWMLAGTLPIIVVAPIWSAYYYLFALCGAGLVIGASKGARDWRVAAGIFLAVLAGATFARQRTAIEVPVGSWTARSHIDGAYVLRSERIVGSMLACLKRAVPRPPPRSTFFFSLVPGSIAFQITDGPLVRSAYRDSSLRSYWLSQMTDERVNRGRVYVFRAQADTLVESGGEKGVTFGTAGRALLQGDHEVARGALRYHLGRWPNDYYAQNALAWIACAEGDLALRDALLGITGLVPDTACANRKLATARLFLAAGDTLRARESFGDAMVCDPLDPRVHAAFADLALANPNARARLLVESYAVLALAPEDPISWRRWAFVQAYFGELNGGLHSLQRYRQLAPDAGRSDDGAAWLEAELKKRAPYAPSGGQLTLE